MVCIEYGPLVLIAIHGVKFKIFVQNIYSIYYKKYIN